MKCAQRTHATGGISTTQEAFASLPEQSFLSPQEIGSGTFNAAVLPAIRVHSSMRNKKGAVT